jgi:hypothetical protein
MTLTEEPLQLALLIVTDPPFAEITELPSWSDPQLLESGAERKTCRISRLELFTIVMAVVDETWACDRNGPQTIMPTKRLNTTREVKSELDLRNVVLMSVTFHQNECLAHPYYGQRLFTVYPAPAPLSTAVPPLFFGTETLTVVVVLLPNESDTLNVIV